jgi:enoyl-CoA hydratase/carnithine racemase
MLDLEAVVGVERHGDDIATILLRRPPANALGLPLIEGLDAALEATCDTKILVVASRISGYFAAGADIKHMATVDPDEFAAYGDALRHALNRFAASERVTIAAVDGLALGGGLELALACTLRIGTERASFGLPEVKLGLIPGAGGTQRLPRVVGRSRALDLMLTGRTLDAQEAFSIGLIDRLVESGGAESAALVLARELRELSQPALHAVVRTVDIADDLPLREGLGRERREEQRLFETGEGREGIAAFVERRPPRFA